MTALQIVKGQAPLAPARRDDGPSNETTDLIVDGVNWTARVPAADSVSLVRDLAWATRDLVADRARRKTVRCYSAEGPWEIGLERDGGRVLFSLYRGGTF